MNKNIILLSEFNMFKKKDSLGDTVATGAKTGAKVGLGLGALGTYGALKYPKEVGLKTSRKKFLTKLPKQLVKLTAKSALAGGAIGAGVYGAKKVFKKTK